MDDDAAKVCVERACSEVLGRDLFLLKHDVSEWAVAHRLAVYLEKYFPEYSVDCEYNRMPGSAGIYDDKEHVPKMLHGKEKKRPDILVHTRGSKSAGNLIAIEIKKVGNRDGLKSDQTDLLSLREAFQYRLVCQIVVESNRLNVNWL